MSSGPPLPQLPAASSGGIVATLGLSDQKGRMGVLAVRMLAAQAGLGSSETSPGEDYLGVDVMLAFRRATVGVQVRAGRRAPNADGSYSVPVDARSRGLWAEAGAPVYLVYVRLNAPNPADWVRHDQDSTHLDLHAYWERVNNCSSGTVRVPRDNRLTVGTFSVWSGHIEEQFGRRHGG